jgi:predicted MFS family arabinose efflux permease
MPKARSQEPVDRPSNDSPRTSSAPPSRPAAIAKSSKTWVLFLMVFMAIFLNADNLVLSPNITAIEQEFGVTDADIGNISGLFMVIGAIISLAFGYMADKGSRKLLFLLSVIIGELPCLLTAFAANYTQFFILRILCGIGLGASFPIVFSLVADFFGEKERAKATALISGAIGLGSVLGMMVGGYGGAAFGWRIPFIIVSAPNFLFALLFWLSVKEPPRALSEETLKDMIEQGFVYPRSIQLADYKRLFTIPTNLFLFVQGLAGTVPWGAIPLFLVAYLQRVKGFDLTTATTVFMFFGLGNIVGIVTGGLIGGVLYRRALSYVPLFAGITTIAGAAMALAVFTAPLTSYWTLVALGFLTALMASLTGPNVKTMLMNVNVPENRGAIFSIFNLTDSLGTGFGRFVGGWMVQFLTIGPALAISSLFWLPCGVLLILLARRFPGDVGKLRATMLQVAKDMRRG